ncbi:gamma-tubulin complex component protein [Absidia repens]|uniref:Gamma-tubulin complex component protein n=1 Tax=Absidia repens TaxID=90262 RepID=A0A1X2J081_9FUNG|nr:gamma-tubulin complex component protein [Absidia repens]
MDKDRSLPAAIQLAKARKQLEMEQDMEIDRPEIKVPDALLLRDLIYIFQGIDGQYITFDSENNEYILDPQVSVPKPTQDLVYRVAELGWLYRHIQSFIDINVDQLSMGLVGQSFCSALQSELMEYYKHIAILEAQIEKQPQQETEFIPNEQSLTLKRLLVWTQESLQRLKLMNVLVDVSQDQKGGALVSTMHNYTNHGDPFFKQYISNMLQEVSKPFYEMLKRWISEGELDDPYGEFFVAIDPSVTEEELWQRKYTFREDMLPSFISPELAQKIFSIGKSLNFIRYSCHDETLVEKYYAENSTSLPWHTFKYGDMQTIELCVDTMYLETSNQLLSLLKNKYKLMDHLLALKRYLLLGQGDFIQYLMGTLGPTLNRPATTLFRHNLTGVLETAIRASNAQFDDPAILNRLDVRLLEISTDDLGWDVFTLDYHADSPINTVLSPPMMNQYLLVFNFLWRLKRVEYTLTAAWRRWGTASRTFASVPELSQDLHEAQMVIASMIHFIYQLQHYYLFEVLECAWEKLETRINTKSIDLDSVIEAHAQYLSDIAYRGFLTSPKHEPLFKQLNTIFDVVLSYKTILDHLFNYGTSELSRKPTSTDDTDKLIKIRSNLNGVSIKFKVSVPH